MIAHPDNSSLRTTRALQVMAERLVAVSERRATPTFSRVHFPETLDATRPPMPEALLSLAEHPIYADLSPPTRWRLGLLEAVNFFSLNIHGEQALVADLAERLYRDRGPGETAIVSRYMQHFIHEENSHTYMLAEFCTRYYGRVMPELVYKFENPALSRAGGDLLLFSRVYVLETFLHFVNRAGMRDAALEPTVRAIHRSHHLDESQHVAFDRVMILALVDHLRAQHLEHEIEEAAGLAMKYLDYAFARLVNPRIYRELGLEDPLQLAKDVQSSPRWRGLRNRCWLQQERFFSKAGMLT